MTHKVTDRLLNYLQNGDEVDRCYAAKTLGNLKATKATNALLERTRDEDIDVCIDAIYALGKIKEPSAIPMLLESLEKDPDSDVKLAVAESLACYQSTEIVDVLLKLAEERPEEMDFDQNADWDDWWDLQEMAVTTLGEMKVQKAFPILKNILEDEFSQDIEAITLKAMAKIGGPADSYLIERLNDNSDTVSKAMNQRRAAVALGFSDSDTTLQALGRALVSPSADIRENVLYSLGRRKATQYIRAILLSLRDPSHNVQKAALDVIQDLASESQIDQEVDFDQIAALLATRDITLKTAVLSFIQEQHKYSAVVDKLSEENQELIRHCLTSDNDHVLTQAAQLAATTCDPESLTDLLMLALSEPHSEWVRKEAILALGHVLNAVADRAEKQTALIKLRLLIQNNNQTVRFAAIEALLTLSNVTDIVTSEMLVESVSESDELPPIAILLATLRGEQFSFDTEDTRDSENELSSACKVGAQPSEDNCGSCVQNAACSDDVKVSESIMQQFELNNIDNSSRLIQTQEEQPMHAAQSTLEAIAMDNVEGAVAMVPETAAEKEHDYSKGPFISENLPEEMDEFVAIMQKNFSKGKKLVRKKIDTFSDARHITARLLAANTQTQYDEIIVNALAECLNDDDEQLRQEAIESLSRISLRNPLIPGLSNIFGKIVTLLDSKDRDMRLACIDALSYSGNPAALSHLLDYLSDEDYLVKLHAIQGLVHISMNKAGLSAEQLEEFMVLENISQEQVIKAIFACLQDKNYSISMAAIEALAELQQTEAIEQFIDVALTDEGQSARRISRLLKKLDSEKSTELLLTRLDNVSGSSYRRHVMEMLEVVITPDNKQLEAA